VEHRGHAVPPQRTASGYAPHDGGPPPRPVTESVMVQGAVKLALAAGDSAPEVHSTTCVPVPVVFACFV